MREDVRKKLGIPCLSVVPTTARDAFRSRTSGIDVADIEAYSGHRRGARRFSTEAGMPKVLLDH